GDGKAVPHRTSLGTGVAGRRGRAVPARRRAGQGVLLRPRAGRRRHADQVPAGLRRARARAREQPLHRCAGRCSDREGRAPAPRRLRLGVGAGTARPVRIPGGLRGLRVLPRPVLQAPLRGLAGRGDLSPGRGGYPAGGLVEVLANSAVQVASESVPHGGTFVTVTIGTFRMVPLTFSTLQMYMFWT